VKAKAGVLREGKAIRRGFDEELKIILMGTIKKGTFYSERGGYQERVT